MKKSIILLQLIAFTWLFLLGISTPVYSQETDYFQSWTTWMVAFQKYNTDDGKLDKLFCIAFQDTLIDGVQYNKVYVGKHGSLLDYWGQEDTVLCYRQEGKHIYRYDNKYHGDIQIYEFGLSKGDVTTSYGFEMVVDSVFPANELMAYCDFPDNVMAYRVRGEENPKYTDIWIDGVGSVKTGILKASDLPLNFSTSLIYCIRWQDGAIYFDYETENEKLASFEALRFTTDDYWLDENLSEHIDFEFIEDTLHVLGRTSLYGSKNIMDCFIREDNVMNVEIIPVYKMGGVDNEDMYWFDAKIPGFKAGTYIMKYGSQEDVELECSPEFHSPMFADGLCWTYVGAETYEQLVNSPNMGIFVEEMRCIGTNVIDGKEYTNLKVGRSYSMPYSSLVNYSCSDISIDIREQDGVVYVPKDQYMELLEGDNFIKMKEGDGSYIPYEETPDGELILYDFNMNVGDKFPSVPGHENITVVATNQTLTLEGLLRKQLTLSNGYVLVEGLGCVNSPGLFLCYLNPLHSEEYGALFSLEDRTNPNYVKHCYYQRLIETVDIGQIKVDDNMTNYHIYDLSGRRLNAIPQRGIYIQNGKKYVVK